MTSWRGRAVAALGALAFIAGGIGAVAPAAAAPLPAGKYVVALADGVDPKGLAARAGVKIEQLYDSALNGFTVSLTSAQATRLAADARVTAVSADVEFEGAAQVVPPNIGAVEADEAPVRAGDGVTPTWAGPAVAVIDSGVNVHTDYNRAMAVNCLGTGDANDGNGHGTGVSGYMAAFDNSFGTVGVAPGAPIYSVRAMDANNRGTLSTLLCAIDWVADNADTYNIAVANMSITAPGADDGNCGYSNSDALHQAICSLVAQGVLVVAAAGNSTANMAGYLPGAYDEVLTATNVADYDGRPGGTGQRSVRGLDSG